MFKIESEEDLKQAFRSIDRDEVLLSQELKFPMLVKDYLAWEEPSGHRVYLVFSPQLAQAPFGIVFRREQNPGNQNAGMCEWCHGVRAGGGVSLLSATASSNRKIGVYLCRDLSCKDKARSAPGAHDFPSTATPREKVLRIIDKMSAFARNQLF